MPNQNRVPTIHQQAFQLIPENLKEYFYIHYLWQGVSCVRLKSGVMRQFVSALPEDNCHMQGFLMAAATIVELAHEKEIWTCVRFSNNGYQSVLVYLGTRNVDEFMRLSKIRQAERLENNMHLVSDEGILDEDGNPYGDR
tara:strand:- start:19307 stop:19726 length:420 start_codon:yes stop_codon:yes gene_type:complete